MKKIYKYSFLLLLTLIVACSNEEGYSDIDIEKAEVSDMSGEWFVKLLVDGEDIYDIGYYRISTYNTTEDTSEIYLDDFETWPLKTIIPVDLNTLTFSGSNLLDEYTEETTVNITEGVIIKKGATTPSGTVTDKISFTIEFSDDPGTIYTMEGYKRTGFLEDEQ